MYKLWSESDGVVINSIINCGYELCMFNVSQEKEVYISSHRQLTRDGPPSWKWGISN